MRIESIRPVTKSWGYERSFVNDPQAGYCGKKLVAFPVWRGSNRNASSIHYHRLKTETFVVVRGRLLLEVWESPFDAAAGTPPPKHRFAIGYGEPALTLQPGEPHRFWSADDFLAEFHEFSSPDSPEDSIRLVNSGPAPELTAHEIREARDAWLALIGPATAGGREWDPRPGT
mgnify:CR=1 FL=1